MNSTLLLAAIIIGAAFVGAWALRLVPDKVRVGCDFVLFCIASVFRTFTPRFAPFYDTLVQLGKNGLTATLFLIGTGMSRHTLKQVGYQPLLQGVLLWIVVSIVTVLAIYHSIIAI